MTIPELSGRLVLVTGGAQGIGSAIVRAFHAQGARVAFCDRDARAGQSLARTLGERAVFRRVDLRKESEIVRWITKSGTTHEPIHALINNAARDPRIAL